MALVLGGLALLLGGGVALTAMSKHDDASVEASRTARTPAPTREPTPAREPAPARPHVADAPGSSARGDATGSPAPSPSPSPLAATGEADADAAADPSHAKRSGEASLRVRPEAGIPATFTGEAGVAHRKRLRNTVEAAACHAPDLEDRYAKLPAADAEKLRATCAKHGVTLRAKR